MHRRRYKKKYYPSRYVKNRWAPRIQRRMFSGGIGFPKTMKMVHKFAQTIQLTGTSGAYNALEYVANGMTTPSAVSGQPQYFDQMSDLYNHYTVIGSKIKIVCVPISGSTNFSWGCYLNDDATNLTDEDDAKQQASCTWKACTANSLPGDNIIRKKWSAKKTFGGSVLANVSLEGSPSANPTESTYYVIWLRDINGTTTTVASFMVEIEYIAIWKEVKDIISS